MIFNGKLIPLDSMEHGNITSNDVDIVDIVCKYKLQRKTSRGQYDNESLNIGGRDGPKACFDHGTNTMALIQPVMVMLWGCYGIR